MQKLSFWFCQLVMWAIYVYGAIELIENVLPVWAQWVSYFIVFAVFIFQVCLALYLGDVKTNFKRKK